MGFFTSKQKQKGKFGLHIFIPLFQGYLFVLSILLVLSILPQHIVAIAAPQEQLLPGAGASSELPRAACLFVLFSGLGRWHFCSVIHSLARAFIWADILIMQIRISLMKKKINFTTVATNAATVLLMSLHF